MKFLCAVLYVLAVVTIIGSALCDNEAGGASGGNDTLASGGCDVQLGEDQSPANILDTFLDRMTVCFIDEVKAFRHGINVSHTTEELRHTLKVACEKLPTISECTADVANNVHKCINETETASFKVLRNDMDAIMKSGCEEDGVKVASIVEEIRKVNGNSLLSSNIDDCLRASQEDNFKNLDGKDTSKASVALYKMFQQGETCFSELGEGQVILNNLVASLFGDIMHKLKCVHPESHVEVLCETL